MTSKIQFLKAIHNSHTQENPFEIDLSKLDKKVYKDSVSIHNHPGGGTFSFEDVSAFLSYNMKRAEIVNDVNKIRYTLTRTGGGISNFNEKEFTKRWEEKKLYYQFKTRSKDANIINSKILSDLADEFGFIYQDSNGR